MDVSDLRQNTFAVDFENHGILYSKAACQISDFENGSDWEASYNQELRALLTDKINAKEVVVFDHTVRIDDPDAERRPARNVHTDYSRSGAEQRLVDIVGDMRAKEFRAAGFGFVNVWRPIKHVIKTSPLGFVHPRSVKSEDWITIDLVYPDRRGEILGVSKNSDHEWFYMSNMTPEEIFIFNIYDNKSRPFVAHSALDMELGEMTNVPRKSIESRTLVRYG